MFFNQCLGHNYFTNRVPRIFLKAGLGGLIKDVRRNKLLDSVTMPSQCNNQENVNTWATHHGKIQGGGYTRKWGFSGTVQRPTSVYPYSTQVRKGIQNPQGKG